MISFILSQVNARYVYILMAFIFMGVFSLEDKIDELAMNSKNKNIRDLYRGINDC
jgi:hypothetical protein